MNRLSNKKILVVGGTSGIGEAIVKKFTEEGGQVAFCGRSKEKGLIIEKNIPNSKFYVADVNNTDELENFFNNAINYLGTIDVAVNNAGISGDIKPFHETNFSDLCEVMNTNFFGIWHSMKLEINFLIKHEKPASIINIASTSGLIGNALGLSPYASSKHAVVGLTKSVALEYAKSNIRINALCPGFVDTAMTDKAGEYSKQLQRRIPLMHPLGRIATTVEIANAALYLASDEASFTTGSCMIIDGGLTT